MSLSFIFFLIAGILAVVAGFVSDAWRPRALAVAVVLCAVGGMVLSGGVVLK